jgi:putative flippase GtrA
LKKVLSFLHDFDIIRFVQFLLIGGIVFVFSTGLLWLFKRKLYLGNGLSISLSYAGGAVVHFTLNNLFTFSLSKVGFRRKIIGYSITLVCNYFISLLVGNMVFKYVLNNVLLVNVASISVTTVFSYCILHKFVFFYKQKGKR